MLILITGANGFVGKATAIELAANKENIVRVAVRKLAGYFPSSVEVYENLDLETWDWSNVLEFVDVIVNYSARVLIMHEKETDPIDAFRKVNVDGTLQLAKQAALSRVKILTYLSSLKADGDTTKI